MRAAGVAGIGTTLGALIVWALDKLLPHEQVMTGHHKKGHHKKGHFKTGHFKTGRVETGCAKTGRAKTGRVETGRVKTGPEGADAGHLAQVWLFVIAMTIDNLAKGCRLARPSAPLPRKRSR